MNSHRAIILAPIGRDAPIARSMLSEAGIESMPVGSIGELVAALSHETGFVILAEEATRGADLRALQGWLAAQPEWSDLPFILLTSQGGGLDRNPAAGRYLETFGNVTFAERPFHPTTLVSLARAALRARRRQYDARGRLETIRLGEQRLRVAVTAGRLGAWSVDVPTQTLETSAQGKAHYGRGPDDSFTFDDLLAGIHPDDRDATRDAMDRALHGDEDYYAEYRFVWPDNSTHWLHVRGGVDRTGPEGTLGISGVSLDITDYKLAEAALQRSEDRFRAAVEAVQGVVWTNTAEGQMRGEQLGWAKLTGQSYDEYQGFGWAAAVHPDDAQSTVDAWNIAVAEKGLFVFEHRVRMHDGSWGQFAVRAIPTFEPGGSIREWVGVHTDVTQQRVNERALADLAGHLEDRVASATSDLISSQRRLRSIFESSFQYFGEVSPDGLLLDANATSLAAVGKRLDEVVGMPFHETPWFSETPGGREAAQAILTRALAGEKVRQEVELNLPGGRRNFDFSVRPVVDADGKVITIVPEAIDVTERRQAEEKLLQSQKLETIGQLTGGVAHDFNNLLTPIIGTLDFLRRKHGHDAVVGELLDGALVSAERGRVLIQRLLAFARRQPLQATAVDIATLIDGMTDLITRSLDPRIEIAIDLAVDLPPVLVDANQLELAILNLAVNARDAMPDGGQLSITTTGAVASADRLDLKAGGYVLITIADTGHGMDAQTLSRAVEPFFSTKKIGEGTGLGLSMVHGFVSQTGGAVDLESVIGQGTTITIWLPVAEAVRVHVPEVAHAVPVPIAPSGGTRVLLVDDDPIVRLNCAEGLRDMGFDVTDVDAALNALAMVKTGVRPDIVVTDYLMPNMNGLELTKAIYDVNPQIPVLLVTGYADLRSDQISDINVLAKPFRHVELAERINRLVTNRSMPVSASQTAR